MLFSLLWFKKKNLMRKLSYLCNLLLTVWSYIFFFQFKIYLTLFSFLIQIYIMYFVSLKHCAACFCYISFWFVFTLLFWVKHVSIIWKCIKSKFSFFVARWYKSLFDKTFKGLLWFILESKFFVSIVIIGNSDPSNSNTTLPLRDFPLKFITPLKYQMLRLKKPQNIPK